MNEGMAWFTVDSSKHDEVKIDKLIANATVALKSQGFSVEVQYEPKGTNIWIVGR